MVIKRITRFPKFIKDTKRLDKSVLEKLKKQITKVIENPEIGKPLKYKRNERTVYVKPFRLIYSVIQEDLILLKF